MRNKSGEYCIQKENQLVWVISELSICTSLSRIARIPEQAPWRMVCLEAKCIYCVGEGRGAWESRVPLWGHTWGYHRLRISPSPLVQSPVPCTTLPPLTKTRTESVTCLSSTLQMFTGVFTKHFKKVLVSGVCLHILDLLSFQAFHLIWNSHHSKQWSSEGMKSGWWKRHLSTQWVLAQISSSSRVPYIWQWLHQISEQ